MRPGLPGPSIPRAFTPGRTLCSLALCALLATAGAQRARGCVSRLDYVRYALVEGLREAERIGVDRWIYQPGLPDNLTEKAVHVAPYSFLVIKSTSPAIIWKVKHSFNYHFGFLLCYSFFGF